MFLSHAGDSGEKGETGPMGFPGPKGAKGETGKRGESIGKCSRERTISLLDLEDLFIA